MGQGGGCFLEKHVNLKVDYVSLSTYFLLLPLLSLPFCLKVPGELQKHTVRGSQNSASTIVSCVNRDM